MPTIPLTPLHIAATLLIILAVGLLLSCSLAWLFYREPDNNGLRFEDGRKIRRQ